MRRNRLLNLLASNAKRGEFRAEGNTIYLYDVIVSSDLDAEWFGGVSAESFIRQLQGMTGEVALRINSPGGDVFAARAMAQAMREYDGDIVAHIDGVAASAASLIAVSASRVVMAPGSFLMIHKAWTIGFGNADELKATAVLLDKIDGTIAGTYAAKAPDTSVEAFLDLMAAETWFTAAEALDIGLADETVSDGAKPSNSLNWDLSAYGQAPAQASARRAEPEVIAQPNRVREPDHPSTSEVDAQAADRRRRIAALVCQEPA